MEAAGSVWSNIGKAHAEWLTSSLAGCTLAPAWRLQCHRTMFKHSCRNFDDLKQIASLQTVAHHAAATDLQMSEPCAPVAFPEPPDRKATFQPSAWACQEREQQKNSAGGSHSYVLQCIHCTRRPHIVLC